ncbi:MAG: Dipeptidase [Bacteroidetes bacterium ADurb.Bin037]|nr:MAG: Dipeptidase [Bacteroidetes bacterium ADurb.Bin037]HPW79136.1 C69 family dipeptidase [Bacteroidales bacterium]HQB56272.1 C69 family dipeptidase [Bacteroidales bacterium]
MRQRILLIAALLCISGNRAYSCTNLLITKGASADGSCMVTYSADSHTRYGCLAFYPASLYPTGTMMDIREWGTNRYLGKIPQATETYSVIGNMNEYQVVIGESTWGGLRSHRDPQGIVDYGSLMYISLQRARTARQAIEVFTSLANQYGYASSGESISFADPHEVWFMDVIGKAPKMVNGENLNKGIVWVAVRLPDGTISAHANQARIRRFPMDDPENCLYAPDVIDHARETGLYQGPDSLFSFADTYGPAGGSTVRGCDARVWAFFNKHGAEDMAPYLPYALGHDLKRPLPLYVKAREKLTVKQVADMMRDHYEGTPMDMTCDIGAGGHDIPYRWRPMGFEVDGKQYINERAIATQQTGFWFVGQCRSWLPNEIGGVFWFGVDDAGTSPLTPVYTSSLEVSPHYALGQGASMLQYSPESMFWLCNRIAQFAYLRYNQIGAEVRQVVDDHEFARLAEIPLTDSLAMDLWKRDPLEARRYLTDYSLRTASDLFRRWQELDIYLLVKYIDGNIKRQNPDGSFATNGHSDSIPPAPVYGGYNNRWKEAVVKDTGERLLAP